MRVCVVSVRLPSYYGAVGGNTFGGAEVQSAFVADALRASGHDVVLVVADLPAGATLPHPAENAYDTGAGLPGLRFFHPRWSGVMAALGRADADVYFQHCAGMITGQVAIFCKREKRAFVFAAGSDEDFNPRGVMLSNARDRLLFRYGLARCSGIVVQNEKQLSAAKPLGRPTRLIPTGIRPREGGDGNARDAIVWIGGLRSLKRPDLFLELARRLPDRRFIVVGGDYPGEPAYSAQIRRQAAALANVGMLGRCPPAEVSRVLASAALLVNTSEVEGFPNAYLEAWSHGVPVITFHDIDGLIRSSGVGVVVGSLEEMAAAVGSLGGTPAGRAMGENGRRFVRERFSPERLGPEYAAFFASLR